MYQKFRVFFTILAALCVAAILPIGSIFGFGWAGLCIVFALLFTGLMILCKQNQELEERKNQQNPPKTRKTTKKRNDFKTFFFSTIDKPPFNIV